MDIFDITDYNYNTAAVIGLILNAEILYLILKAKILGNSTYNFVLIQSSVVNLVYVICILVAKPYTVFHDGATYMFLPKYTHNFVATSCLIVLLYWGILIYLQIILIGNNFFYRYLLICHYYRYTHRYGILSSVFCVLLSLFVCSGNYLCLMFNDQETMTNQSKFIMAEIGHRIPENLVLVGFADGNQVQSSIFVAGGYIIIPLIYCFNIIAAIKTHKFLKKSIRKFSHKTLNLHVQYTKVVVVQSVIPFVSFVVPMTFMAGLLLFRSLDSGLTSMIALQGLAWIPAINALVIFLTVKPFYRYFLKNGKKINSHEIGRRIPLRLRPKGRSLSISSLQNVTSSRQNVTSNINLCGIRPSRSSYMGTKNFHAKISLLSGDKKI